jgi:hypothetical protein
MINPGHLLLAQVFHHFDRGGQFARSIRSCRLLCITDRLSKTFNPVHLGSRVWQTTNRFPELCNREVDGVDFHLDIRSRVQRACESRHLVLKNRQSFHDPEQVVVQDRVLVESLHRAASGIELGRRHHEHFVKVRLATEQLAQSRKSGLGCFGTWLRRPRGGRRCVRRCADAGDELAQFLVLRPDPKDGVQERRGQAGLLEVPNQIERDLVRRLALL